MKSALIIAVGLALCACEHSPDPAPSSAEQREVRGVDTLPYARVPSTELHGSVINDDTTLAAPSVLCISGDFLLVGNSRGDSAVIILDQHSGRLVTSFGRNGEGPGEYRSVVGIQADRENPSTVWLYDMTLRRLTQITLNRNADVIRPVADRSIRVDVDGLTTSVAWLTASSLIGLGFYESGRLSMLSDHGVLQEFWGPLPPNPDHVPSAVLQHAYQSSMAVRPNTDEIAVVTRHASNLEIYDRLGHLTVRTNGPFAFTPTFGVAKGVSGAVMSSGDSLRFGYIAIAVTKKNIYALFSGRTRLMYPGEANLGEYVHVFAWDGAFEAAYHLDQPAIAIAVDTGGTTLYAASYVPRPVITRYALPQ